MDKQRLRKEIMDWRDMRVRMQYKVIELEEKEFWEPDTFSPDDKMWLDYYRDAIARIKAEEQMLRNQMR